MLGGPHCLSCILGLRDCQSEKAVALAIDEVAIDVVEKGNRSVCDIFHDLHGRPDACLSQRWRQAPLTLQSGKEHDARRWRPCLTLQDLLISLDEHYIYNTLEHLYA